VKSKSAAFALVVIAAAALRLLRMGVRWDEIALAYAAYAEPLTLAVAEGHPTALLGSWIGLHPPLWGMVQAVMEQWVPIPWVWLGFSAMCSVAAVWVVGRTGGVVAALVLATAPVHLLDSAEVNNYPMASLAIALLMVTARGPWAGLAFAAVFAAWSHLLAGVGAFAVVAWRLGGLRPVERRNLLFAVALGMLPIGGGALRLMGQGSTWSQPQVSWSEWGSLLATTVGPEGLLLAPVMLWGLRGHLLVGWASMSGGLLALVAMGAAAAHQRPYLGLIAPIAALAIARSVLRKPVLLWVVVGLTVCRGVRFASEDLERIEAVVADLSVERAVDTALASARPGDAVWLVSPALQTDDDKTAFSGVLWRIHPWERFPIDRFVSFEYKDYRYGQPRNRAGVTVHTSTELDAQAFDHVTRKRLESGGQMWVVLYDYGPATGMVERIERVLQPYDAEWSAVGADRGLGVDRMIAVKGLQ